MQNIKHETLDRCCYFCCGALVTLWVCLLLLLGCSYPRANSFTRLLMGCVPPKILETYQLARTIVDTCGAVEAHSNLQLCLILQASRRHVSFSGIQTTWANKIIMEGYWVTMVNKSQESLAGVIALLGRPLTYKGMGYGGNPEIKKTNAIYDS